MSDIEEYLKKHRITEMLNGIVNELVVSKPDDPIDFLMNGLLKEASTRQQTPALVARLQDLRQTLLDDQKAVASLSEEKTKQEEECEKHKYNVTQLRRAIDDLEAGGATKGGTSSGVAAPAGLIGVPAGHTAFSWAGGMEVAGGAAVSAPVANGAAPVQADSADLPFEPYSARVSVATMLKASAGAEGKSVVACGWVKTNRNQKKLSFMSINDGSAHANLQLVLEKDKLSPEQWEAAKSCGNGSAVRVEGKLKASPAAGQKWELPVESIEIIGGSDAAKYPIPPQKITLEKLRDMTHMRPRTGVMGAVMRVRNALAFATHKFFQTSGFMYIHAPLMTGADCEGAGEMFQVTTLDLAKVPTAAGAIDYTQDFFGKPTYLTVSGQLNGEYCACAFGSIYTFGPTFRAENSNTRRHLAEFWMIEPEIAFCDIHLNMNCAEGYLRYCFKYVLDNCADDLAFLEDYEEKRKEEEGETDGEEKLRARLEVVANNAFARITYTEAVELVSKVPGPRADVVWEYPPKWGEELQTEHEKYLAEVVFKKPVIVYNYPKGCKAFYMRLNDDDATVGAMDVLFPRVGEMVGGSQREERLDVLLKRMGEMDLKEEDYSAYLDTRRFGTQPHSGFGVGFERLVLYATSMGNIRDVIPFPRAVGQCAN